MTFSLVGVSNLMHKLNMFGLCIIASIAFGMADLAYAVEDSANTSFVQHVSKPKDRIQGLIDDNDRVTLAGNHHPRVAKSTDLGRAKDTLHIDHMILSLMPDTSHLTNRGFGLREADTSHLTGTWVLAE